MDSTTRLQAWGAAGKTQKEGQQLSSGKGDDLSELMSWDRSGDEGREGGREG